MPQETALIVGDKTNREITLRLATEILPPLFPRGFAGIFPTQAVRTPELLTTGEGFDSTRLQPEQPGV